MKVATAPTTSTGPEGTLASSPLTRLTMLMPVPMRPASMVRLLPPEPSVTEGVLPLVGLASLSRPSLPPRSGAVKASPGGAVKVTV